MFFILSKILGSFAMPSNIARVKLVGVFAVVGVKTPVS
jgi:hypothetical protein